MINDSVAKKSTKKFLSDNCALCGKYAVMTGEHTIASWIGKEIMYDKPHSAEYFSILGEDSINQSHTTVGGHKDSKIKVLCETCNSVWSSGIQNETQKFLKPILRGEKWYLSQEERQQLATWASLFVIVRQFLQPSLIAINAYERRAFYESTSLPMEKKFRKKGRLINGSPITGIRVWIANFDGDHMNMGSYYRGLELVSQDGRATGKMNTYFCTVAFKNVALFIMGSSFPLFDGMCSPIDINLNNALQKIGFCKVWPNYSIYPKSTSMTITDELCMHLNTDITEYILPILKIGKSQIIFNQ